MHEAELNPAQQELLDALGASPDERPRFDPALRTQLRLKVEEGLDEVISEHEPDGRLRVNKHRLAMIMGCERRFLAEADAFSWSVPKARGSIAHKAIELSIHTPGIQTPMALVNEAIAALTHSDNSIAEWLQECSERELAELRGEANDSVAKFLECWPPLKPAWLPVTESKLIFEHRSTIVLSGKVDLSLGRATGDRAGKVLIDLKTGGSNPHHIDDLRFYALLEALRVGTPPRLLATYYLDQGRLLPEAVTEDLLHASVARVVDGVARIVETERRLGEPSTSPGPPCRWCVALADCEPGRRYLRDDDPDDDLGDEDDADEAAAEAEAAEADDSDESP